ncbi:MAG TPA: Ig-like domain-containing protein, partial [Bacteroidales bacterium]|nr:Ig-like domain-containing protein [Bacteroidales bacterium]
MQRKTKISYILYSFVLALGVMLVFNRCAKEMTSLSGGPRDTIPPKLLESEPPNYSVHFDSKEIEIEFNEFIQLQEVQQQFLSSPPFEEDPEIKMKGKGIEIELKGSLEDSTTYTLNFGNAIVDYTEGNPLRNFKYVFSTGDALDSMRVAGRVYDAFSLRARENVLVMLYDEMQDSVPYREIPDYVSRTGEEGFFSITNVRKDSFKLFALDDLNGNYLYDSPDEAIAFVDSAVTFEKQWIEHSDTLYSRDTTEQGIRIDSSSVDTVIHHRYMGFPTEEHLLSLFNEDKRQQYLRSFQRNRPMKVDLIFNAPIQDSVRVSLIDSVQRDNWYLKEIAPTRDTLTYWLKDTALIHQEYVQFELEYQTRDSLNNQVWTTDTLDMSYLFEESDTNETDTLALTSNAKGNVDLNQDLRLSYPNPIQSIDTSAILLHKTQEDSLIGSVDFTLQRDSQRFNRFHMSVDWDPASSYRLRIMPQAVKSIYHAYHDTLNTSFTTREEDYYGTLIVSLQETESDFVLQLIQPSGEEEKVIREKLPEDRKEGSVTFRYLDPG